MCIADVAISRRTYTIQTTHAPGTRKEMPNNPNRVGLIASLYSSADSRLSIFLNKRMYNASAPMQEVYYYNTNASRFMGFPWLLLTYHTHPGIIHSDLVVASDNSNFSVIEILADADLSREIEIEVKKQRELYARRG